MSRMNQGKITLAHGSGTKRMHQFIQDTLLAKLDNPILRELADAAILNYKDQLAFTTDSFVVSPLEFPGGDIGKLAVCGTVNDLVMMGALPQYLSLALIVEEGLPCSLVDKIAGSIAAQARQAGVSVVSGDFKVVEKGACDKLFINTSGIGKVIPNRQMSMKKISVGDAIIITGPIGSHGFAVLAGRKGLDFGFSLKSDCASLAGMIIPLVRRFPAIKFMRDPTRGGLSAALHEIIRATAKGVIIEEKSIPLLPKVKAAGDLLGIDPIHSANEGVAVIVVDPAHACALVSQLRKHPLGRKAALIGRVSNEFANKLIMRTTIGTRRIIDELRDEPLPRIC